MTTVGAHHRCELAARVAKGVQPHLVIGRGSSVEHSDNSLSYYPLVRLIGLYPSPCARYGQCYDRSGESATSVPALSRGRKASWPAPYHSVISSAYQAARVGSVAQRTPR